MCQPPANLHLLSNTTFTLVDDTILSTEKFKIYPQQKWRSSKGSDENGWYKAITFKNLANWAILIERRIDIESNPDYQADESRRDKDKVKEFLNPGNTLEVTKIQKRGNQKFGYKYVVSMK